mmetsp:Transcript_29081/g.65070  ORF Transcript_29081/g.65070 Transcript_29081/m.65070 type:complete len:207 (-) Transcript_29081:554-1174(-)
MLPITRPRDTVIMGGACEAHEDLPGAAFEANRAFCPPPQDFCVANYSLLSVPCDPMRTLLRSDYQSTAPADKNGPRALDKLPSTSHTLSGLHARTGNVLPPHIDFASVDVEENYMSVLDTLPWCRTRLPSTYLWWRSRPPSRPLSPPGGSAAATRNRGRLRGGHPDRKLSAHRPPQPGQSPPGPTMMGHGTGEMERRQTPLKVPRT